MGRRLTKPIKRLLRWLLVFAAALVLLVSVVNQWVSLSAQGRLYTSVSDIPARPVGVLLGTSKYLSGGGINPYYQYRIDAALSLYRAGKVSDLILSGDNAHRSYDEPTTMRRDLMAGGIPAQRLHRDYAGFRTLDSVVRANKVFGQGRFTVISQRFHNERAIYLARAHGLDAIGFDARDVEGTGGARVKFREGLARVSAVMDVLFGREPKFLGDPEVIGSPKTQ
ncbi:vancomycin high temperature exclusion protein [Deinococcus psychrotolerans]|uniref:Vancomycin high temperature exclusion protein n=1 Tax=Deinococcus psychrotolerans TaxID=2489213 RepID=A0A3G8YBH2_9DEIO|nr:vancomycin high temperature exclusion protein [Deinococcus psychrotolerans]